MDTSLWSPLRGVPRAHYGPYHLLLLKLNRSIPIFPGLVEPDCSPQSQGVPAGLGFLIFGSVYWSLGSVVECPCVLSYGLKSPVPLSL